MKYLLTCTNPNDTMYGEPYTADGLGDAADELFQMDGFTPDELVITDETGKNCNRDVAVEWLNMNVDNWADDKGYILPFVNAVVTQTDIDNIEAYYWESVQMDKDINSRGIYA
jgi:hypothetical protein